MRGLFVVGTGGGTGASVTAAAIAANLSARGQRVATFAVPPAVGEFEALVGAARAAAMGSPLFVADGSGGLLAPLTEGRTVRDLAAALDLPLVVAARPGPDSVNHALLTVAAGRALGLRVPGVVLTPWPARPGVAHEEAAETIAALAPVEVARLRYVADLRTWSLTRAGAELPVRRWLRAAHDDGCAPRRSLAA